MRFINPDETPPSAASVPSATMKRAITLTLVGLALAGCSANETDAAPTGRIEITDDGTEFVEFTAEEQKLVNLGQEATDELPDDLTEELGKAFVLEDYDTVCAMLDTSTAEVEKYRVLALDSDAWYLRDAIFGEAIAFGAVDQFKAQCDVQAALDAMNAAVGR